MKSPVENTASASSTEPFGYCLNTSTIRGARLPLTKEIEVASAAGYGAIEPWIEEIEAHLRAGGSLRDLRKQIEDAGLKVAGAVGFAEWIVSDRDRRTAGLEQMRRDMEWVAQIGGRFIASPAVGAQKPEDHKPELNEIAERYRAILELGERTGVTPALELWGFSKTLSRLSEVVYCAAQACHPSACLLLDSYHLYKGGSDFAAIHLISGEALPVFHINDYPDSPDRAHIDDAHRVYPGDGVAPLGDLLRTLRSIGFTGVLSVELFNPEYWQQPAEQVAKAAIDKTRALVRKALEPGR